MAKRIGAIKDDMLRFLAFIESSLDEKLANEIGLAITNKMLELIANGISPIEGVGRFPAYKWAAFKNELKKERTAINKALKKNKNALIGFRRKNKRQILLAQKNQVKRGIESVGNKYPFNTEEFKRGEKRLRPVNLLLTGQFLSELEARVTNAGGRVGLEIGFFDELAARKESGHREGVNGQPSRPTIPVQREEFAQVILREVFKKVEGAIDRATFLATESIQ